MELPMPKASPQHSARGPVFRAAIAALAAAAVLVPLLALAEEPAAGGPAVSGSPSGNPAPAAGGPAAPVPSSQVLPPAGTPSSTPGCCVGRQPSKYGFVTNMPCDLVDFGRLTFRRETIAPMALIAVSTALMIRYDGHLYDETVQIGDKWGIPQENRQLEYVKFRLPGLGAQVAVFTIPGNMGGWLYFLGNGWFYVGLIGSFWGYGMAADNQRAVDTAADITEAMTINGAVVLALKMSTGRETPNTRETPSGRWRFFRNPWQYLGHVSKYDAFPSGHLATAMAAATVVGDHYPEYRWIYPLSYAMMVPLTFQMVNSGVHWYSDYPLAIYIGSTIGKAVVGRRGLGKGGSALLPEVTPVAVGDASGLLLTWRLPNGKRGG